MTMVVSYKKLYLYSLWLYFIAVPLGAMNIGEFGSLLKVIGLLPVLFAIIITRQYEFTSLHFLYFGYVLLVCLSFFWSINPQSTQGRTITLIELSLLMASVSAIDFDDNDISVLKKALVWSSRITAILLLGAGSMWQGRLVLSGIIKEDPNYICMYFSFGAVNAAEQIFSKDKILSILSKVFYIIEGIIYLYAVLLTGSRGGLLAIMVCLLLSLLFSNRSTIFEGRRIFLRLIPTLGAFFILYYLLSVLSPLLSQRFTIADVVQSGGTGRIKIWENGIELYRNSSFGRQVFGYGAATNMRAMQEAGYSNAAVMHNIFLETLVELGSIGFLHYTIMILTYISKAAKIDDKYSLCVITGFVVMSLSTSLYAFKPYINIMIFIIINTKTAIQPSTIEKNNNETYRSYIK